MDTGGPLLDTSQITWQGRGAKQNYHSHVPVRPSVSNQNLLADNCCPDKGQQGSRAGVWRTPFSQQPTPTPCIQPVRIDIPVTRPLASRANPPLTTFQHRSRLAAPTSSRSLQVNGHWDQRSPKPPVNYACPIPVDQKLLRLSRLSQQLPAKPQVSITPTKHVSFREPPSQQKHGACPVEPKDFREPNETPKLSEDEILEQEVKALQAKEELGVKETERLGRLSLEWQFQKRLREIQQRGEDEDEDDDDLDMMVMIREMEKRAQVMSKESYRHWFRSF